MLGPKSGRIITFYSYKGGTGRTMAAANMAWILASNGHKVLLIDWDLESPGLHRYLRPFLADPDLASMPGLIDFACEAAKAGSTAVAGREQRATLMSYAVPVKAPFAAGSIEFLGAGRQDQNYQYRVNTFNWRDFHERAGGHRLFDAERASLKANYDYVLIDSRTGVGDTSGICTMQMPDLLVVLFTLNYQNIEGAAAAAAAIQTKRADLPIFPVPTRIEHGEQDKLAAASAFARRAFAPFLLHVQSNRRAIDAKEQAAYWRDVETPYVAFYAFEEIPATFKDEPGSPRGLLAASERLASWITDRAVSALKLDARESRRAILEAFAFSQNRATRFDWAAPAAPPSGSSSMAATGRQLGRYGWPAATAVLAAAVVAILAVVWRNNEIRAAKTAALTAQLEEAARDLSKVQTFAYEPPDSAVFPKVEFVEGFAALQRALKQLEPERQITAAPPGQDGANEPSPPKPQQRVGAPSHPAHPNTAQEPPPASRQNSAPDQLSPTRQNSTQEPSSATRQDSVVEPPTRQRQ